jgi:hypothetical protein
LDGSVIYYSKSENGGISWTEPEEVDRKTGENRWASSPEIIAVNENEVHITWVCGVNAHRCHRWSIDNGFTWSNTNRVFGEMLSLAGWDTLVVDGCGQLYWIMQLRYPVAIYYSLWTGKEWSGLRIVTDGILAGGHYLRAVVHNGNQMDLVAVDQGKKEIWYISGVTDAAATKLARKEAHSTPVTISITLAAENAENQIPVFGNEAENNHFIHQTIIESDKATTNPMSLILTMSILPVIVIFIVTFLIKSRFFSKN